MVFRGLAARMLKMGVVYWVFFLSSLLMCAEANALGYVPQTTGKLDLSGYLGRNPELYYPCSSHEYLDYCQPHYRVRWDSESRVYDRYRVTPYLNDKRIHDYTLVTHSSIDRLHYLKNIREAWAGPISLSIWLRLSETQQMDEILETLDMEMIRITLYIIDVSEMLQANKNCVFRPLNETVYTPTHYPSPGLLSLSCVQLPTPIYPINTLRVLAINNIVTTHFLNMDMDLWPSPSTYSTLKQSFRWIQLHKSLAIVLPAFQFTKSTREVCASVDDCLKVLGPKIPKNKSELKNCSECQVANAFSHQHKFITDEWWKSSDEIMMMNCLPFVGMEPYVVLRRIPQMPLFNEQFINYGYNKLQFIEHLRYCGYTFAIFANSFGFDVPHKPSPYAKKYEASFKQANVVNADVQIRFLHELYSNPSRSPFPICKRKV